MTEGYHYYGKPKHNLHAFAISVVLIGGAVVAGMYLQHTLEERAHEQMATTCEMERITPVSAAGKPVTVQTQSRKLRIG